jgi:hemolysin activation/secretion protein
MLVTIVARIGGNAIDGNTVGVGTNIKINSSNTLTLIPIYGENSNELLFEADYSSNFFFGPDTALQLLASKIGGRRTFSTGVRFTHSVGGHVNSSSTYAFNFEEVDAASLGTAADEPIQQPGNTNNISLFQQTVFGEGEPYSADLTFELEHSQPAMDSDFKYTSFKGIYGQQLDFHVNHALRFELIRGLIDGKGPIQKQHLLGDPLVLRGFPRTIGLVSDNIAALRLEYQFVATRRVFGETMQNRKLTLLFFGDIGKGWNNGETSEDALTRRDVGVGFTMDLSLLNTLNFPLRLELAYPVGDPEYKDRQVILLQALSFF